MARLTLSDFLNDRNLLAIKISSHDLGGFFRKSLTIPLNTSGLALFPDGTSALYAEGSEVSGRCPRQEWQYCANWYQDSRIDLGF